MGEAKRNREALLIFIMEQRLAGLPICTCPLDWFSRSSRFRMRMVTQEDARRFGESHHRTCEMAEWLRNQG